MKKTAKFFTRFGLIASLVSILSILMLLNINKLPYTIGWGVLILVFIIYIVCYIVKESVIIDMQELKQEIKYKRELFQYNRAIDHFMMDDMDTYGKLYEYITDEDLKHDLFLLYMGHQLAKGFDVVEGMEKLKFNLE